MAIFCLMNGYGYGQSYFRAEVDGVMFEAEEFFFDNGTSLSNGNFLYGFGGQLAGADVNCDEHMSFFTETATNLLLETGSYSITNETNSSTVSQSLNPFRYSCAYTLPGSELYVVCNSNLEILEVTPEYVKGTFSFDYVFFVNIPPQPNPNPCRDGEVVREIRNGEFKIYLDTPVDEDPNIEVFSVDLNNSLGNYLGQLNEQGSNFQFNICADGTNSLGLFHQQGYWEIGNAVGNETFDGALSSIMEDESIITYYEAPQSFQSQEILLNYYSSTESTTPEYTINLTVEPVPTLFLHGLWSNGGTWSSVIEGLINSGWESNYLATPSYNANLAFYLQTNFVQEQIDSKLNELKSANVLLNKISLVGHSMGGLIARQFLRERPEQEELVYKLITINTPHSGSEIANYWLDNNWRKAIARMAVPSIPGANDLEDGAVSSLRVDSPDIQLLNSSSQLNVPKHVITSIYGIDCRLYEETEPSTAKLSSLMGILEDFTSNDRLVNACRGLDGIIGNVNDGVVRSSSQYGGFSPDDPFTSELVDGFFDAHHIRILHSNFAVTERLPYLLQLSNEAPEFTTTGFSPPVLEPPLFDENSDTSTVNRISSTVSILSISQEVSDGKLFINVQGGGNARGLIAVSFLNENEFPLIDTSLTRNHVFEFSLANTDLDNIETVIIATDGNSNSDWQLVNANISNNGIGCQPPQDVSRACGLESLVVLSQAQVDAYAGNETCEYIEGNVVIRGNDISDISSISDLKWIGGNLTIQLTSDLKGAIDLSQLQYVGGFIWIDKNDSLNLVDLSSLSCVNDIYITSNSQLEEVRFSPMLEEANILSLRDNRRLIRVPGIDSIITITDRLFIGLNDSLSFDSNPWNVNEIRGHALIWGNESMLNLDFLHKLDSVGDYLQIHNNPSLQNISGLSSLQSVGTTLSIHSNDQLMSLHGLQNVNYIPGDLEIGLNPELIDLNGLENIDSVGMSIHLYRNDKLKSVDLLSLKAIGSNLSIEYNASLEDFDGLLSLKKIDGNLDINDCAVLSDVRGLDNLNVIDGILAIDSVSSLNSLVGLENVDYTLIDSLVITNSMLLDFCNIPNVCNYLNESTGPATIFNNSENCLDAIRVLATCQETLPIEILSFDGHIIDKSARLTWVTQNEYNVSHFKLEYSSDQVMFSEIYSLDAVGDVNTTEVYSLTHQELSENNFYRLKIFESDGAYNYSNIISLPYTKVEEIRLSPNPSFGIVEIINYDRNGPVEVCDAVGKIVFKGDGVDRFDVALWAPGIYFVTLSGNKVLKLIKK